MFRQRLTRLRGVSTHWTALAVMATLALPGCGSKSEKPAEEAAAEPPVLVGTFVPNGSSPPTTPDPGRAPIVPQGPVSARSEPAAAGPTAPPEPIPSLEPSKPAGSARREFACSRQAAYAALSPDDTLLAVSLNDGQIVFFDAASGGRLAGFPAHRGGAALAFSPDGTRLASGGYADGQVKLWSVADKRELATLGQVGNCVKQLAFSDNGNTLTVAGGTLYAPELPGALKIWDLKTQEVRRSLVPHKGSISSVVVPQQGDWMATSGIGDVVEGAYLGELKVWSRDGEELLHTFSNPLGNIGQLALSPDDRTLAVAELGGPRRAQRSGWIRLVDTETWRDVGALVGHGDLAKRIAFSPDGKRLASGENFNTIYLWDIADRRHIGSWRFFATGGNTLAFDGSGQRLLCQVNEPTLVEVDAVLESSSRLDDPQDRLRGLSLASEWEQPSLWKVTGLRFGADGSRLAVGDGNGFAYLYDVKSGDLVESHVYPNSGLLASDFTRDLKWAAAAYRHVVIWDIATGNRLGGHAASPEGTFATVLSPDGELLATCHPDSAIRIWHVPTCKLWASVVQLESLPTCLTFSPDSKSIASGSSDHGRGPVVVWQLPAQRPANDGSQRAESNSGKPGVAVESTKPAAAPAPAAVGPSTVDAQVASNFKTARALVHRRQAWSDEFHQSLQSVAASLPQMPVAAGGGAAGWQRLTLNASGLGFDCFRIRSELDVPGDLCIAFIEPKKKMNWYVLPVTGRMQAADDFEREDGLDLAGVEEGRNVIFQVLAQGTIRPRGEYLVWFSMGNGEEDGPLELSLLWNVVPFGTIRGRPSSDAVAKAVGIKTPLRFRLPPAEALTKVSTLYHGAPVKSVAFSSDGSALATAGGDNQVRIWERTSGQPKQTVSGALVALSPDGKSVATAGTQDDPTTIVLWDVATGKRRYVLEGGHLKLVEHLAYSPGGSRLASACSAGIVTLWDTATGRQAWQPEFAVSPKADTGRRLAGHKAGVLAAAFSPVNDWLVTAGADSQIVQWNVSGFGMMHTRWHRPQLAVAYSPDGKFVASGGDDNMIHLFTSALTPDTVNHNLVGHGGAVMSVAFDPKGRWLASASADRTVRIWDVATRKQLHCLTGHERLVRAVAVNPVSGELASASWDSTVRLWDPESGKALRQFAGHEGGVDAATFTKDGKLLLTGSGDHTARLWEAASGKELRRWSHPAGVGAVAFALDGTRFATGANDGVVRLFATDADQPFREIVTGQGPRSGQSRRPLPGNGRQGRPARRHLETRLRALICSLCGPRCADILAGEYMFLGGRTIVRRSQFLVVQQMSFPQTRLTLIQRLATEGNEDDWRTFVRDYWGPVCRFALRGGAANAEDAEDVALETFEVLWSNRLLVRWVSNRSAKLRTLLCGVVRNNLANRGRVRAGRERILNDLARQLDELQRLPYEQSGLFYGAWAEDVIERAVQSLAADYGRDGKGDYLRVLYGRICEELTIAACAEALNLKPATVDNYYRHARSRLSQKLRETVAQQVARYASAEEFDQEMELEWARLGEYLCEQGGLEDAVRRAHRGVDSSRFLAGREAAVARLGL
ncbi:MAG TPA: hypothetical protein VG826_16900 [Pirellulales bacterium]|nr:hypothetical protein [Pirellulales bacterium]